MLPASFLLPGPGRAIAAAKEPLRREARPPAETFGNLSILLHTPASWGVPGVSAEAWQRAQVEAIVSLATGWLRNPLDRPDFDRCLHGVRDALGKLGATEQHAEDIVLQMICCAIPAAIKEGWKQREIRLGPDETIRLRGVANTLSDALDDLPNDDRRRQAVLPGIDYLGWLRKRVAKILLELMPVSEKAIDAWDVLADLPEGTLDALLYRQLRFDSCACGNSKLSTVTCCDRCWALHQFRMRSEGTLAYARIAAANAMPDLDSVAVTIPEAAKLLGKSQMTVRRYVVTGRLTARKVGHDWVIEPKHLHRFLIVQSARSELRASSQIEDRSSCFCGRPTTLRGRCSWCKRAQKNCRCESLVA
jgi:excisionase family DNA binding protein